MDRINDILQSCIRASNIKLSYIEELFPDFKNKPYIVLHKNLPKVQFTQQGNKERTFDEYSSTKNDFSGSPLEYSFGNDEFDDITTIMRQNWRKEEELYLPLDRMQMCHALNVCLENLDNNALPILALCDGKDFKKSRLLGSMVHKNWFTTMEAVSLGVTNLITIRNEYHKIVQEHLKQAFVQEHDIKISVLNIFDIFGTKQERIDWDTSVKSDFEGSISIESYSDSLILNPRSSKNTLITQVNVGWKNSSLKELRSQLVLLMQYLSVIGECKKFMGLQSPIKFMTPYLEEHDAVTDKLNLLLNGDFRFGKFGNNFRETNYIDKENIEVELLKRVQNVSLRLNMDFTDFLWEILIKATDYLQIVSYIEKILKEYLEHKFIPQVNDTNTTRFIKRMFDLHEPKMMSHLLVGSIPLEFIVDMGFQKLIRDYLYILRGARFIDLYDIRQKLVDISTGPFNIENYRKLLTTLTRIHTCLECMLLIEAHLDCPMESLQSLFAYVWNKFISEQSPLQHYDEFCKQIYTFTAQLPDSIANGLNQRSPTIWRASLSSETVASSLTTTTYYSKMPIFPTNIYATDDINTQEETFYGIRATSSSAKYKKM